MEENHPPYQQNPNTKPKMKSPGKGFVYGLICFVLLPVFYNPFMLWIVWLLSIIGLVYSIKELKIKPRGWALAGLILSAYPIPAHFILGYPDSIWYVNWLF